MQHAASGAAEVQLLSWCPFPSSHIKPLPRCTKALTKLFTLGDVSMSRLHFLCYILTIVCHVHSGGLRTCSDWFTHWDRTCGYVLAHHSWHKVLHLGIDTAGKSILVGGKLVLWVYSGVRSIFFLSFVLFRLYAPDLEGNRAAYAICLWARQLHGGVSCQLPFFYFTHSDWNWDWNTYHCDHIIHLYFQERYNTATRPAPGSGIAIGVCGGW